MRRFRFSLHALWVLRGQQEELARRRYAESLRAVEAAAAQVRHAEVALREAADTFAQYVSRPVSAAELEQYRLWLHQLQALLRQRQASWRAACETSARAGQELLKARRHREILDRYRQRQWQSWQLVCQRLEQKELDELSRRQRPWMEPQAPLGPSPSVS